MKTLKERTNNYTTYTDDGLGPAYRDYKDTPSLVQVMLDHFVQESKDVEKRTQALLAATEKLVKDKKRFDVV